MLLLVPCAPARIGIATGVLQNRWGIYRNIDTEAHGLKPGSHLVEKFKEQGMQLLISGSACWL